MNGETNTPTDREARTILDVANDIRSDGTNTFAQEMARLVSESRETRDQSKRMGEILGISEATAQLHVGHDVQAEKYHHAGKRWNNNPDCGD